MCRLGLINVAVMSIVLGLLSACGSKDDGMTGITSTNRPTPEIIKAAKYLQCVPYAREASNIEIYGDAWTWWNSAKGKYERGGQPKVGSILVLAKTSRLRRGHIAVVTRILNNREVLVDHANWLNGGRIHKNQPVRDMSRSNDWSAVKFWYTPGNVLGKSTFPVQGFIHAS